MYPTVFIINNKEWGEKLIKFGTDDIDLSRTSEETDSDDVPPVSTKMTADRCRGNSVRHTIMIDSGDEGDVHVEREGSPYQTTE